jgi:K+-transporting ATPase ATPase A chain
MLVGRFLFIIPLLAAAGSLAAKKRIPVTAGTLPTHRPQFIGLLIGTILVVSALTYLPVLALGPLAEGLK